MLILILFTRVLFFLNAGRLGFRPNSGKTGSIVGAIIGGSPFQDHGETIKLSTAFRQGYVRCRTPESGHSVAAHGASPTVPKPRNGVFSWRQTGPPGRRQEEEACKVQGKPRARR